MKITHYLESARKLSIILTPKERKNFGWIIVFNIIAALLELLSLGVVYPLILSIVQPRKLVEIPFINFFLENYSPLRGNNFIIFCVVIVSLAFILKNTFLIGLTWYRFYYFSNLSNSIGVRLFKNYLSASYEFHVRKSSSKLLRNIISQVNVLGSSFIHPIGSILENMTIGIPLMAFLCYLDPFGFLFIFLTIVGPSVLYTKIFDRRIRRRSQIAQVAQARKNTNVIEGLANIKETKILKKGWFFSEQFRKSSVDEANAFAYQGSLSMTPRYFIETVSVISIILVMCIMIFRGYQPGEIVTYMGIFGFASLKLLPLGFNLLSSFQSLAFGTPTLKIIFDDLENLEVQKTDLKAEENNETDFDFQHTIEIKDLSFSYSRGGEKVIDQLSMTVRKNQFIALVGSTGAGKTTLVDIMIGLLQADAGSILVDGLDVSQKQIWTSKIGYVPQEIYLLDGSIKKNIAFGITDDLIDLKQIWKVIKIAQLEEFVLSLPDQIDTEIGERGVQLSGGQRQRISIARALYHNPEILVLDEATSALDNITEQSLVKTLNSLQGALTVIVIAHRLTTVEKCDLIYVLEKGKIIESGNFRQLSRKGKKFRSLLEAPKRVSATG